MSDNDNQEIADQSQVPALDQATTAYESVFNKLAALSPVDYDRCREQVAKSLGIRIGTLDGEINRRRSVQAAQAEEKEKRGFLTAIEPWEEAVNGAALLDDILASLKTYAVYPPMAAEAIALWCVFAHAHDAARHSPVLALTSPEKACGKTTILGLIEKLVPKPLQSSNITMAAVFRAIEKWGPTLLIDEADTFLSKSDEMRGVLNSGHKKTSAHVIRSVGEEHEPHQFRTWSPKVIAAIGDLPDTLADRSINIPLRRRLQGEQIVGLDDSGEAAMHVLCRKAARWSIDNYEKLKAVSPSFPDGLRDRAKDNWRTILSIAELVGGHWPETARLAAVTLSSSDDTESSAGIMLLVDIRIIFESQDKDRLQTSAIIGKLTMMHERPWAEWRKGQIITPRALSKLLEPFNITPEVIRIGNKTPRGYRRDVFQDAWDRYLPLPLPTETQQCNNPQHDEENATSLSATDKLSVADLLGEN